jgi:hypothetical protein
MKHHQTPEGKTDDWITPPEILFDLGHFDFDPCPYPRPNWDGLKISWYKARIWCNPPFNRYERPKWMRRMAEHGNGILLIPAATETEAFYEFVWERASSICFVKGRPHFYLPSGKQAGFNCGCSIVLVAYGEVNSHALQFAKLGITINLNSRKQNLEQPQLFGT